MSKVLYACSRHHDFNKSTENKLREICQELTPDNVTSLCTHRVCVREKIAYAVTLHNSALQESELSLLLGFLYEKPGMNWRTPKQNYPDGNYAIFRKSDAEIEIVSDGTGSRTIWYYHDDELFIASTSQRAIILFLGTFVFDERVIPWVLSTGSLGPCLSWDKRLKRLQADSSVLLNKRSWHISVKQSKITFSETKRTKEQHKELLVSTLRRTISFLEAIDFKRWVLPLSGGYDSRAILCFIKGEIGISKDFKTVTWGLEQSISEDGNDAKIARALADSIGVQHDYYHTDISSEPIEVIVDRFLLCGEGRIDHISGYMDGMEIWRKFHDENVTGIIRGDIGFGWKQVSSELTVRLLVDCALCTDFENLKRISDDCGLPSQEFPPDLLKGERESLSAWRDRLYQAYRLPTILAALSDIKLAYIEQVNPLLSKYILNADRSMPDRLRGDRILFREIVDTLEPDIPFADKSATANVVDILKGRLLVDFLKSEIDSCYANQLFGSNFVKYILDGIKDDSHRPKMLKREMKESISSLLPQLFKNWLRDKALRPSVDGNTLAFRVVVIIKMHKILTESTAKFNCR